MENLVELKREELAQVDGGFWPLAYALVYATVAIAGAAIYGSAEAGYDQACKC